MILLAIQTKGGVGKSTISQQVLAPYFLAKDEPATLIEIDDENLDSAYLHDSLVKAEQLPIGSGLTADRAIESLMARVNENLVVDIGGNKTGDCAEFCVNGHLAGNCHLVRSPHVYQETHHFR